MSNLKYKLMQFFSGRYGADQLYYAFLVLCLITMIINSFIQSSLLNILVWLILIVMIYRSFSRNIYKRQMENAKFVKVWNPVKAKFKLTGRKIKEIKTNYYHTCPNCKVVIRLPRKKGKHTVECPNCHRDFQVRVRL